jgi:hypothetical protein
MENLGHCVHVYLGQLGQYVREFGHVPLSGVDIVGEAHLDGDEGQQNNDSNGGVVITTGEDGGCKRLSLPLGVLLN